VRVRVRGGLRKLRPKARRKVRKNARRVTERETPGVPSRVAANQRADRAETERGRERGERQEARDDDQSRLPVRSSRSRRSSASFGDREATEAACRRDGSPAREGKTKIAQMPRVGSPRRPARDRRRRLPETSATRLHAACVPVLRARVAPRADAAAKRTGGEPTHRATLPKPARL